MIIPLFKIFASCFIIGLFIIIVLLVNNLIYLGIPFLYAGLFFGIVVCILGLLFLGIIYVLWDREISGWYTLRENKKK